MEQLNETAMKNTEKAAKKLGSLPKDKEDIVAALSQAFQEGVKIGASISEERATA